MQHNTHVLHIFTSRFVFRSLVVLTGLMRMKFNSCQLAYLCTYPIAIDMGANLPGGVHISGAFQMAGAPCTVSLWRSVEKLQIMKPSTSEGFK